MRAQPSSVIHKISKRGGGEIKEVLEAGRTRNTEGRLRRLMHQTKGVGIPSSTNILLVIYEKKRAIAFPLSSWLN